MSKQRSFFENAHLLNKEYGIVPLMYGSLGLEYLTGENLCADDIDILIPKTFIGDRWNEFKGFMENHGYFLIDEHEHTFEKDDNHYSYAQIEDLESFANISLSEIKTFTVSDVIFKLLSLEQYLLVYTASSKDGYRVTSRNKKDNEKIALIREKLQFTV